MVVSKNYASGWSDIVYDVSGRAIATNLDLTHGSTVRIVPTYGVTGSNLGDGISCGQRVPILYSSSFSKEFLDSINLGTTAVKVPPFQISHPEA